MTDAELISRLRVSSFPETRNEAANRLTALLARIEELEQALLAQIEWACDVTDEELRAAMDKASSLITPSQALLVLDARAVLEKDT